MEASRLTRGKIELRTRLVPVFELARGAAEARREVFERKKQRFEVVLPAGDATVVADPDRLEQVLSNLLDNASKYTAPGGAVRLDGAVRGDRVSLRILDEGAGIAADDLPNVFDPFFQSRPSGSGSRTGLGLGLTIVRQLVELHRGTVSAYSRGEGLGSEFVVDLPLASAPDASPREPASADRAPPEPGLRILVVDDNVDAAETLAALLTVQGHEVRTAHDGFEGVEAARIWTPDVGILDISMPGMDGHEAARAIRKLPEGGGILLAALSGFGQPGDLERARAAGFDRHLTKPARSSELAALLRVASERRRTGQDRS